MQDAYTSKRVTNTEIKIKQQVAIKYTFALHCNYSYIVTIKQIILNLEWISFINNKIQQFTGI